MKIAVVDYGAGNLRSVAHALNHLDAPFHVLERPDGLEDADGVILPGVGAFGAGMDALRERGFIDPLRDVVAAGVPLLGICLGLQYLFEISEEMGEHAGLGLLPGRVVRFPEGEMGERKVPHMGWNQLRHDGTSPLLEGIPDGAYTYFVHSFYAKPADSTHVIARTDYGIDFASVVGDGSKRCFGVQFHPEKSQRTGLRLLANFVEMCK